MTNGWHPPEDESQKQSAQAAVKTEPRAERRDEKVSPADDADRKDGPAIDDGE
ncbi:MAG: hypothetical protein WD069_21585 [Planctomycetales bacterium]